MVQTTAVEEVPAWCGFFDVDQFGTFCEEVDDACGCFGAEGQDLESGFVELAAGVYSDIHEFSLEQLAKRCSEAPPEDWESLCFGQIDAWSAAEAQSEWLEQATLDQVRDRLRIHLYDGGPRYDEAEPEDPEEWFRLQLADGLWVGLVVAGTPSSDDDSEIDTQVHNAAVQAWGVEPDRLVEAALANLRREQDAPAWGEVLVQVSDEAGEPVETITLLMASGSAAWALLLDEVEPELAESGVVLAVPSQDTLLVAEVPEEDMLDLVVEVVAEVAGDHVAETEVGYGIDGGAYWYQNGSFSRFEVSVAAVD